MASNNTNLRSKLSRGGHENMEGLLALPRSSSSFTFAALRSALSIAFAAALLPPYSGFPSNKASGSPLKSVCETSTCMPSVLSVNVDKCSVMKPSEQFLRSSFESPSCFVLTSNPK